MLAGFALLMLLQNPPAPGQAEYEQAVQLLQEGKSAQALSLLAEAYRREPRATSTPSS